MDSNTSRFRRLLRAVRSMFDERLQPPYLRMASVALLIVGGLLLVISFATSDRGRTLLGPPLGNDFAGFFVAAQILERGEPSRLYDRALHDELYHELLPNLPANDSIPYVHPPFVAGVLRPLTWLPYDAAVAVWLVLSLLMFVGGVGCLLRSLPDLAKEHAGLVLLLSLSFEPFLMECWLGGQLSAVGFLSSSLAWLLLSRGRPIAAGMALGLSFYKPTLLLLMLPLLVVGRCGRVLLGMTLSGVLLAGLSMAFVGWDVSVGYLDVLLSFRKSTSGGGLAILTWKYVDLNNSLKLLLGSQTIGQLVAFGVLSLLPFAWLARTWWRWPTLDVDHRQRVWAATLAWVPVLNLYVGIYDSLFVVASVLLAADGLLRHKRSDHPLAEAGLSYWALAIAGSAWFSQSLAKMSGVQVYTLALIGWGLWTLTRCADDRALTDKRLCGGPTSEFSP